MEAHRYLPMTEEDKQEMLQAIGVQSIEDLLADIPEDTRFNRTLAIERALKEPELLSFFFSNLLERIHPLKNFHRT